MASHNRNCKNKIFLIAVKANSQLIKLVQNIMAREAQSSVKSVSSPVYLQTRSIIF